MAPTRKRKRPTKPASTTSKHPKPDTNEDKSPSTQEPNTTQESLPVPNPETSPLLFYGPNHIPHGILSQHHPIPFTHPSHPSTTFTTAEQYMMYRKAVLFSCPSIAAQILLTSNPRTQKSLGRKVRGFDEGIWEKEREGIVEEGNFWKFGGEGREMSEGVRRAREVLLGTGERELVEASPRDRVWGVGFGVGEAEGRREEWGLNLLGKCLMRVRERIRMVEERKVEERRVAEGKDGKESVEGEVVEG
ncbi:YbiA-like protein [Glarea lozoyensis ATCC 20868]|uniref:YbiA-like protein n=1 Tax=Glarea lozoyensis (strain ATCC 20868 / MF5171) TaxID=1116229 RepID=S3DE29_GLAL2|nr:YbiA-like protein [Glarea lozoyensis ATCC 20868]EPE24903.1 YbiA-like protein [Glarea lozoyensis ATCC 20868]